MRAAPLAARLGGAIFVGLCYVYVGSARLGSDRLGPARTGPDRRKAGPSRAERNPFWAPIMHSCRRAADTCAHVWSARARQVRPNGWHICARARARLIGRCGADRKRAPPPPLIVSSAARRRETSSFRLQRLINQTCACSDRRVCRCGAQINHTVRTRSRARAANSILDAT